MIRLNSFKRDLFRTNELNFERKSLDLFRYQAVNNKVYRDYLENLEAIPTEIQSIDQIPFLPIRFFKDFEIRSSSFTPEKVFESSGTTGQTTSKHYIEDIGFYHRVCQAAFNLFYGDLADYHIVALLPSYLERANASLVNMAQHFIEKSASKHSGFYLDSDDLLYNALKMLSNSVRKTLLIGVTFALMDIDERVKFDFPNLIVMETGGMKGRRKEITRGEIHHILKTRFKKKCIHSEYGMTELHTQAYSGLNGWFQSPPWMKVYIREVNDPFTQAANNQTGGINIVDLANVYSCAFIETEDMGVKNEKEEFQVLGRMDNTDVRGCNLMLY